MTKGIVLTTWRHFFRVFLHHLSRLILPRRFIARFMSTRAQQLQEDGQSSYRRGDYDTALSELSEALLSTSLPLMKLGILDNRAAVQEKLGAEYHISALKDARRMMSLQRASPKGYLRAGKILQLMGKYDIAAENYEYGLRQLEPADVDGKRLLEGMLQKVILRLEPDKPVGDGAPVVDPLRVLPIELADMIFSHLPFETLMRSQRVCRGWRMFLVSYYRSFTTIDFSTATRPVSQFTINKYLQRARFKMRKVVLEKTDQTTMLAFVSGCRYLSELSINSVTMPFNDSIMRAARSTPTLMVLEVGCPTTSSAVAGVIKHAINLQILRCSKIIPSDRFDWDGKNVKASGLKTLSLTWYSMDDYYPAYVHSNFDGMLEFLPELRELELVRSQLGMFPMPADVSGLKHLETFVYRGTDIWQIPTLPESLRHLNLSGNPSLRFRPERDYIPPNLESLSIQENPRMGNDELLSMLAATAETKSLRSLDIGRCPKIDADSLDWLVVSGLVENLEVLSLQGNLRFGDQVTKELGRMVKLRRLNVGSTRISGVGVSNLVHRKESRLEWLGLDYCPNVGVDATGIVKSMGVEVSCKVDKSFVKEKKLRYTIGL